MIRHQHIGMYRAAKAACQRIEMLKVEQVIRFGVEADGAVVAALNDVPGNAGNAKAGATGHGNLWREESRQINRKTWSVPYYSMENFNSSSRFIGYFLH